MKNQNIKDIYLFHLEKAYKQFKKYKTDFLKKAGINITSDQWILLKNIREVEGINQRDLAERCFKEPASVTRILDILEKKGWVERRAVPNNRRTYALYTSKEGKAVVAKILPLAEQVRAKGKNGITEEEVRQLTVLLHKVFENFSV